MKVSNLVTQELSKIFGYKFSFKNLHVHKEENSSAIVLLANEICPHEERSEDHSG